MFRPATRDRRRRPRIRGFPLGASLLAVIAVGGCSVGSLPSATSSSPTAAAPSAVPSAAEPTGNTAVDAPAALLAAVIADAVKRTGAPSDSITVVEAKAVTWTNGALGCPSPGVMYTDMIVQGWQVILDAAGTRIDYRASGPDRFRVCEKPGG